MIIKPQTTKKKKITFAQYCKIIMNACKGIAFISPGVDVNLIIKALDGVKKAEELKSKIKGQTNEKN